MVFTLSPAIGDVDLDGVTLSSSIELNGGTIKDNAGNDATLTFTPPNTAGIKINYPSLGMDFTNGTSGRYTLNGTSYNSLSSFLTASGGAFARNSIATYFDSTGNLQTVTANTPRFDYDPVTHQPKGILIESNRSNLILRTDDYTVSPWAEVIGGTASRSNTTTAFYNKAALVTVSAATGGIRQRVSSLSTQVYSWSFYIESANATNLVFRLENGAAAYGSICSVSFNPSSGVFSGSSGYTKISAKALGSGWLVSLVLPTAGGSFLANLEVIGTNGNIFKYALPQFEQSPFSTSYIPTTSTAVTRMADVLTIPTASWFSAASGGLYAEAYLSDISSSQIFAAFTGAASYSTGNGFLMRSTSASVYSSGGNCCAANLGIVHTANSLLKTASAYEGTTSVMAANNLSVTATNNDFTGSGTTQLFLGGLHPSNTSQSIVSGNILRLKYYPTRPATAQLQLLTQ